MYDFSLDIGDTTHVGWNIVENPVIDTALAIVQSVDTIMHLGIARKRLTVLVDRCPDPWNDPLFTPMEWLEGIGSTWHPFYSIICLCDHCETGVGLQCVDSLGTGVYRSSADAICERTLGQPGHDDAAMPFHIVASPGILRPQFPSGFEKGWLTIIDAAGRDVLKLPVMTSSSTIAIDGLASGAYSVVLQSTEQRWSTSCSVVR